MVVVGVASQNVKATQSAIRCWELPVTKKNVRTPKRRRRRKSGICASGFSVQTMTMLLAEVMPEFSGPLRGIDTEQDPSVELSPLSCVGVAAEV